jgi:predicted glycosyltransferase
MPQSTTTQTAKGTGSIKPSKQRKRKGMLVIRSSHSQVTSPPPTSHLPFNTPNQHLSHQSSNDNVHSVVNNKLMMTMAKQIGKASSTQSMAIKQQQHLIVATSGKAEHHQQFYVPRNHNVQYDRSVSTGMLNTRFHCQEQKNT